ncbi:MAG: nickel-dependent hydrogenase large subunit [Alsobacter sp.]
MNAALDPGLIDIDVAIAHGCVCSVTIGSSRPLGVGRMLRGRSLDEAQGLVGRLFSLCGVSQAAAADLAAAAARGQPAALGAGRAIGLLAERVSDLLRSSVLGGVALGVAIDARAAAALREALAAARLAMQGQASRDGLQELGDAAAALGVEPAHAGPRAGSLLAALASEIGRADRRGAPSPDALAPADDRAVVAALAEGREAWAAHPALPGRVVETGCYARCWQEIPAGIGAMAARFAARLHDLAVSLGSMERIADGAPVPVDLGSSGSLGPGQGFSAVESPRGRLYHLVRCDGEGRVVDYAILAPTEWNFHPAGPLVADLLGAPIGDGAAATVHVERLAGLFDPCVASRVHVRELAHA